MALARMQATDGKPTQNTDEYGPAWFDSPAPAGRGPQIGVIYGNSPRLVLIVLIVLPVLLSLAFLAVACVRDSAACYCIFAYP